MVINQPKFNEKADRAFTRSAIHGKHFNISIRAVFGERNPCDQKFEKKAIDNARGLYFYNVIEMLAIAQMQSDEIIRAVAEHIHRQGSLSTEWFSGIRRKTRVHPWDEAELPFPTSRWIVLQADSPIEARNAVERLADLGLTRIHGSEATADAAQVFAYALN